MKKVFLLIGAMVTANAYAEGLGDLMMNDFQKEQEVKVQSKNKTPVFDNGETIHSQLHNFYLQQLQKKELLKKAALEKAQADMKPDISVPPTANKGDVPPMVIATPLPAVVNQDFTQEKNVPKLRVLGIPSTDMKVNAQTGTITLPNGTVITPKYTSANLNN